jgi:hypothetical protein
MKTLAIGIRLIIIELCYLKLDMKINLKRSLIFLLRKQKSTLFNGIYNSCAEDLDDAFRFAPSVSAKILKLKLQLISGSMEEAKGLLIEILKQHPMYASFLFVSLDDSKLEGDVDTFKQS